MSVERSLDHLHRSVTQNRWAQLFTVFTRCLLGLTFIPPSITKILHKPFTILPDSSPVGHYFNALMDTGFYYEFIGWSQMLAAILLLIPRTSHIGALIFLPIIANIAVLTSSVGFKGTWLITILMSLAAVYLVGWEYDRLKPVVFADRLSRPSPSLMRLVLLPTCFGVGGAVMGLLWSMLRLGNFSDYNQVTILLIASGAVFGLIVALHYRWMPIGDLTEPDKH